MMRTSTRDGIRTSSYVFVVVAATTAALLTGCTSDTAPAEPAPTSAPLPSISVDAVAARGKLESTSAFDNVDPLIVGVGATAHQITYRSSSGTDGSSTIVSGVVFVPEGDPPPGGRSVVTVGHGTTGVGPWCFSTS